jgi:sugar phosphate permease
VNDRSRQAEALHRPPPRRVSLALSLSIFLPFAAGYYLSYFYRSVNAIIAPNLAADASLSASHLGLLTSVYFLTFALFQLPLGVLLDRFGPRRIEAILLLFAAAGAGIFALASGLPGLTLGRALIGIGVSCCMMAAFKAFVLWFPPERLPFVNGCLLTFGALGALTATAPVEWWLTSVADWRALFVVLALATAAVAIAVYLIVPDHQDPPADVTLKAQLAGVREVFTSAFFWRVGFSAAIAQGASLAVGGLWAGPWLRDVAGLERGELAVHLMILAAAMGIGFFTMGTLADRLSRVGIKPLWIAASGMTAFTVVMILLAIGVHTGLWLLLAAFGFLSTAGSLSYAVLSQHFPRHLAARVNTAQNLLVFVAAFLMQWGVGGVLGYWEDPLTQTYPLEGYRVAFGGLAVLQIAALGWLFFPSRRRD